MSFNYILVASMAAGISTIDVANCAAEALEPQQEVQGDEIEGADGEVARNVGQEEDHQEGEEYEKGAAGKRQHLGQQHLGTVSPPEEDSGSKSAPEPGREPAHEPKLELPPQPDHHEPKAPQAIIMDCPDVPGSGGHLPTLRTSDFYTTCNLPRRFDYPSWFYGYGIQRSPQEHPFYRTTSSDYGRHPPTIHSVPTSFFPNNQEFSKALAKTGMYRNYSLNTGLDAHI